MCPADARHRRDESEAESATDWSFSDDSSEARETRPEHHREEVERCSAGRLSVAIHLFLEGFDGGIECRQLPFSTITPEPQHRKLSFLMLASQARVIGAGAAAERRKHVSVDAERMLTDFQAWCDSPIAWLSQKVELRCELRASTSWCRRRSAHHNSKPHESQANPDIGLELRLACGF